jgi:hypothetical protein
MCAHFLILLCNNKVSLLLCLTFPYWDAVMASGHSSEKTLVTVRTMKDSLPLEQINLMHPFLTDEINWYSNE